MDMEMLFSAGVDVYAMDGQVQHIAKVVADCPVGAETCSIKWLTRRRGQYDLPISDIMALVDLPPRRVSREVAPPPPERRRTVHDSGDEVEFTHMEKRSRKNIAVLSTDDAAAAKQRETERREKTPAMRRGGVGAPKSPLEEAEATWRASGEKARSRFVRRIFRGVSRGRLDKWRWARDRPDEPLWDLLAACADDCWSDVESDADDDLFFIRNRLALYAGRNEVADAFGKIDPVAEGGVTLAVQMNKKTRVSTTPSTSFSTTTKDPVIVRLRKDIRSSVHTREGELHKKYGQEGFSATTTEASMHV